MLVQKIILALTIMFFGFSIYLLATRSSYNRQTLVASPIYQKVLDTTPILPKQLPTKLLFLGDIMLGRSVNLGIIERNDVEWPLRGLYPYTHASTLAMANLESPLINNCPQSDSGYKFCGNASNAQALVAANIKLVTIANNHIANYGEQGIQETTKILKDAGISVVGTQNDPVVLKLNGESYAFFGANDVGGNPKIINAINDDLLTKIAASKSRGELVVVGVHWGNEYTSTPSVRQLELGSKLLSAGATIIAGHHPHWVQPVVKQGNTLTMYSLGNTVFDQEWSKETKKGVMVEVIIKGKLIEAYREIPVYIKNFGEANFQD